MTDAQLYRLFTLLFGPDAVIVFIPNPEFAPARSSPGSDGVDE